MSDLKDTAPIPKEATGFVLRDPGPKATFYKVGKKGKWLNHSDKEIEVSGQKVPPASQAVLKEMYDADSSYAKFVTPPAGYKAPWEQKA